MKNFLALFLLGLILLPAGVSLSQEKSVSPLPSASAAQKPASKKIKRKRNYITLNFNNIEVATLVKVMSELTRRNFILDDRVKGKVTLMTPTKISPNEAYQVFLSALEIKGFTAVEDGKVTRIIPTAFAKQSGLKVLTDDALAGEGYVTRLMRLSYVDPQDLTRSLSPLISKNGSMIAYPATSSLIVTDSAHNIIKIELLVRALDVAVPEGKGKINVYSLKHGNAEEIAEILSSLVAKMPKKPARAARPARGAARAQAGPATILEGSVTITADKATNSLIVVASPIDYETIKDVMQKLDIRRRQVFVEAAIIEMGLATTKEFGFEFRSMSDFDNDKITAAGGTNFGNIGQAVVSGPEAFASFEGLAVGAVKGTFTFKGIEFANVGALLVALQGDTDVNVLSTPNILTTDNQEAEIMVGENIPFITGQTQSTVTGSGSILSTIERQDVGITLKLTPQITSDDNVRLDVYQEISSVTQTPGLDPNVVGPSTNKRFANTTVIVKGGETIIIGGLIRDNVTASERKVPLLGDIPILGWLFKSKTTKVEKVNLMLFITPHIIKDEKDAAALTRQKGLQLDKYREKHRIEKKEYAPPPMLTEPGRNTGAVGEQRANVAEQIEDGKPVSSPAEAADINMPAAGNSLPAEDSR